MYKKNKIKVLFVLSQMGVGGSERVVLDLTRSLNHNRFEIYVVSFKGGELEDSFKKSCKKVFFVEKKPGFDISAMVQVAKLISAYEIDVVNAHHYMPYFYSFIGARLLSRRKLIYTEHSVPEVEGVASGIHGKIFNWMLFQTYKVVGVSNEIAARFKELYPRHECKFMTILNGVDVDKFCSRINRNEVRKRWGFSQSHFVIGTVGNFRNVKNHKCLVKAAARLKTSYPHLRVLFVGVGFPGDPENSEADVRQLINELGLEEVVILAGYQEDIPEILSAFDVFCLPSFSEGLPVSLLEAMAAGVPAVGSRVRGIKEVIIDRVNGLLFQSNDDSGLARVLEEILSSQNLAQALANRAFNHVKATYCNKAWTNKVSNLFLYDS